MKMSDAEPIPLSIPDLGGKEAEYLLQCVRDNWVSSAGPFISQFEQKIAEWCGRKYAVATVNGTTALHLALVGAGARRDTLVAVPDWTFAASVNAVCHSGAEPLLVDVSKETWGLDADMLRKALHDADKPVSAVLAVDPLGYSCDMDTLSKVCSEFGIPLIEDAAGALGAYYRGQPAGSVGDMAIFSFNGNKVVTAGGGGMIVTDDRQVADRMRSLAAQARQGQSYVHTEVGFNYRMTNLNAAVGMAQFERLDEMVGCRRAIAAIYDAAFSKRDDIRLIPQPQWSEGNAWLYSVRCASQSDAISLVEHLKARGIEARVFWQALSIQPAYKEMRRCLNGISHQLSGTLVSLPSSSNLTNIDQERVLAAMNEWRGGLVGELKGDVSR